jgi:ElaB/YqjD/DUF883 family membrane-anchored ribosome-binding protein
MPPIDKLEKVSKKEKEDIRNKINELIDTVNTLLNKMKVGGAESLTQEELDTLRKILRESKSAIPEDIEDVDFEEL